MAPDEPTIPPGERSRAATDLHDARSRFDRAWRHGDAPRVEDYLPGEDDAAFGPLLAALLRLDIEWRAARGERPTAADYLARFPAHARAIEEALGGPDPTAGDSQGTGVQAGGSAARTPEVTLTVVRGPRRGQVFALREPGKYVAARSESKDCQLPLGDGAVSRPHFMIELGPGLCRLMDMASRNGTFVNDAKVLYADLNEGDRIAVGETVLRVSFEAAATGPTPVPLPPPSAEEGTPDRFPGYSLEGELGRGGMGVVYLARRLSDGLHVALKTVRQEMEGAGQAVSRFLREAAVLRALRHPNIVAFHEMGVAGSELYFAMEYVPGENAAQLVRRRGEPLEEARAVRIACQVLDALAYAQGLDPERFVHRDIKPGNILVAEQEGGDVAKLADFGLARLYQVSRVCGLTLTGGFGGTLGFMAPEQLTQFHEAGAAADQYGLAATLYYLLTRKRTHDFPNTLDLQFEAVVKEDARSILERRPELSPRLAAAVQRALARDPRERFVGFTEMRDELLACLPAGA